MQNFKYFTEAKMTRQHFQLIADVIASLELMKSIFSQSGREYPLGDMTVDDFEREYDLILKKSCKMSSRKRALVVDFMDIFIK